jgi:hypothetical protein
VSVRRRGKIADKLYAVVPLLRIVEDEYAMHLQRFVEVTLSIQRETLGYLAARCSCTLRLRRIEWEKLWEALTIFLEGDVASHTNIL